MRYINGLLEISRIKPLLFRFVFLNTNSEYMYNMVRLRNFCSPLTDHIQHTVVANHKLASSVAGHELRGAPIKKHGEEGPTSKRHPLSLL